MRYLTLLFLLLAMQSFSQDLSGIWRGNFRSGNTRMLQMLGEDDRYKFEVQLDQKGRAFNGVTYSYKTTVFYGKAVCKGTINPSTRKVLLEEMKIVEVRMAGGDACIMTCFLQYSRSGQEEFLEGTYTSMNVRDSSNCGKGTLFLRKVATSDFYKEPFLVEKEKKKKTEPPTAAAPAPKKTLPPPAPPKKPVTRDSRPPVAEVPKQTEPAIPEKPPVVPRPDTVAIHPPTVNDHIPLPKVLATRENELVKTIFSDEGTVSVNIYDNGTIDNDTVSVYLDKKLVVSRQRLTEKAITVNFKLNAQFAEHELVMVAENLGEIPPNTSLMVVKVNGKQYEVRITSTEQKNAVVRFRLTP